MIYFDNAATTRPERAVAELAAHYLDEQFYNPSALYAEGYNLHRELEEARRELVSFVSDPDEFAIVMTSCGTEADNQAIFCGGRRGNIVTTMGEHAAVYAAAQEAGRRGTEARFAPLNPDGSADADALLELVDDKTSLVSVIHVNNETGAINDINTIAERVKAKNPRVLFHSDGVQAFGKLPFRLGRNIDMYSVSAHKIGGLKGTGALIKRKKLVLQPYIWGGGQEGGLRSGTENVLGIAAFRAAARTRYLGGGIEKNYSVVRNVQSRLWELLDKQLFERVSPEYGSPYILTVAARGVRGETILHMCDDRGLIIGTGSACSSNAAKKYSRVMQACGLRRELIDGVLRLSFNIHNTADEAERAAEILNDVVRTDRELTK